MEIFHIQTEDSIMLYWDKLVPGDKKCEISLDGKKVGETNRTHFELEGLQADKDYEVTLHFDDGQLEMLNLKTEATRKRIDITKEPYCAVGDGVTMNREAIQRAIDDCRSGETVYIPAGTFITGALNLHSDMELYLEKGAVLQGTDEPDDYLPRRWSRFEGTEMECYSSLLNLGELNHGEGYNCKNVIIRGKGELFSGDVALAKKIIKKERILLKEYMDSLGDRIKECESLDTIPGRVRPRLINMSNCQNIFISGITLGKGASWNVHMIYSDNVVTQGCTFISRGVWNGDGWDPDSSTNCTLYNSVFYTEDDSVAIKSGKNPEGNVINRPCEHIKVFDCRCAFGHGICIGSEISGGIEDVRIWDCDMSKSMSGLEIKGTKKRGGYVKDVHFIDCSTPRIMFHSVPYNDDGIGAEHPPVFENCSFEGVTITGEFYNENEEYIPCDAIELCGFNEKGYEIKDIVMRDITLGKPGADGVHAGKRANISLAICENITLERIKVL